MDLNSHKSIISSSYAFLQNPFVEIQQPADGRGVPWSMSGLKLTAVVHLVRRKILIKRIINSCKTHLGKTVRNVEKKRL